MRETIVCALAAVLVAGTVPLTGLMGLPRHFVRPALADEASGTSRPDTKHEGKEHEGENREGTGFDGEKLFATSCGWCHASGGRAAGKGPKLAGTDKSDEFIVNRIKHGKPPVMPSFAKTFSDEQIKAIVAYIHSLKGEQG